MEVKGVVVAGARRGVGICYGCGVAGSCIACLGESVRPVTSWEQKKKKDPHSGFGL